MAGVGAGAGVAELRPLLVVLLVVLDVSGAKSSSPSSWILVTVVFEISSSSESTTAVRRVARRVGRDDMALRYLRRLQTVGAVK